MPQINELLPREHLESMSRRERKKQETRWKIYDAAIELMSERDYDEVKIEDICALADVSNASFFHHFTTKAALIRAFVDNLQLAIERGLEEMPETSSREQLVHVVLIVQEFTKGASPFMSQVLGAFSNSDYKLDFAHADTGITGILSRIIRQGQKAGEFDRQWDPAVVAVSLCASWIMLPLAMQNPKFCSTPHRELLDLMLAGLTTS